MRLLGRADKMQLFPLRMRLGRGRGGEAAGKQSALPICRSGLAKKIVSIHINTLVYFCLLESKEGTLISNDCKNVETDLSCVEALPLLLGEELDAGETKMISVFSEIGSNV